MAISNNPDIPPTPPTGNSGLPNAKEGKTPAGRTVQINQACEALKSNLAKKSTGVKSWLANAFSSGKRKIALNKVSDFFNSTNIEYVNLKLDDKYKKYLPKSTLACLESLRAAISLPKFQQLDSATLKSIYDGCNPTQVGEGGCGTVYVSSDGQYVFKQMKQGKEHLTQQEVTANQNIMFELNNMQQGEQAFCQRNGDNITRFCGTFQADNGETILVFAKAPGQEMAAYLKNDKTDWNEACQVRARMCAALANTVAVTHEAGLVNRDVKPENTMVHVAEDGSVTVRLIDQGLACRANESEKLIKTLGTPDYMAPEYFTNPPSPVSSAADVYALGATLVNNFFQSESVNTCMRTAFFYEPCVHDRLPTAPVMDEAQIAQFNRQLATKHPRLRLTLNSFNRQNFFDNILAAPERYRALFDKDGKYSHDELQFLCGLIRDCLNPDPNLRPTAAQVGYVLEIFAACMDDNARIKAHNAKPENRDHPLARVTLPSYQDVMARAKADRPAKQEQPA
ncbi:MAG: protein kinase [Puniceicoccales bacterium]|jgi:serine/threonine protein kinase|nr:protein kinase [Puniceicoccales bacterium]